MVALQKVRRPKLLPGSIIFILKNYSNVGVFLLFKQTAIQKLEIYFK